MKDNKTETNNGNKPGKGHQARVAIEFTATVEVDGKKTEMKHNYDLKITVEQIDYAVRQIAGRIAKVASKVADEGKLPKGTKFPKDMVEAGVKGLAETVILRKTEHGEEHVNLRGKPFKSGVAK